MFPDWVSGPGHSGKQGGKGGVGRGEAVWTEWEGTDGDYPRGRIFFFVGVPGLGGKVFRVGGQSLNTGPTQSRDACSRTGSPDSDTVGNRVGGGRSRRSNLD